MTTHSGTPLLLALALSLSLSGWGAEYTRRAAAGAPPGSQPDGDAGGLGLSYVTYLDGDALFESADTEGWAALAPNLSLRTGDRLWAGSDARIEVRLPDAGTAWLHDRSELDLVRLERGERGDTIQLALVSGEGYFDVRGPAAPDAAFQVDLPGASLRPHGQARFRVNALPDGSAQIGVVSGSVDLEIPDGVTTVREGQLAELRPDQRVAIDFLPAFDDWDTWVQGRADLYDRPAASARYLPPEMTAYAQEFDDSGRWVNDPGYGSVWVPVVDPGWSPYSNGRWVWEAGDYVWLPYDRWYAPFHYGRWNYEASLGWFWVAPQRAYWSPGYVAWSLRGDEVCWVPLGHREAYHGYRNYGPPGVNADRSARIDVTNVYVNSRVTNGVVAVKKEDFLRGRIARERVADPGNLFLSRGQAGATVIGRPPVQELTPSRETRLPRPEAVGGHPSKPPERVERESRAIRQRSLPKEKEGSAFVPGRRPPPLRNVDVERGVDQAAPPARQPVSVPGPEPGTAQAPERPRPVPKPVRPAPEQPIRQAPEGQPAQAQRPTRGGPEAPEMRTNQGSQRPVGKRSFRRVPEPPEGAGEVPAQEPKGQSDKPRPQRPPERDDHRKPAEEEQRGQ